MPAYRFYLKEHYRKGEKVALEGGEQHHLVHVMRRKEGDAVELVNGKGQLALAEVLSSLRNMTILRIIQVKESPPPTKQIILAQAITRMNRLDTIVEKGTELGMTSLWLFPGEKSEIKELLPKSIEKMNSIAAGAMKQCGSLYLPDIVLKPHFSSWKIPQGTALFFGDVDPEAVPLLDVLAGADETHDSIIFAIGPEAGFSDREITALKGKGVGVKLHTHILRADTAPLVALAFIHNYYQTKF